MTVALVWPAALVLALLIDRVCGEPPLRWHPVVWIGAYLGRAGRRLPELSPRRAYAAGAAAWLLGAALVTGAAALLEAGLKLVLAAQPSWWAAALVALVLGLLLKPLLAWRLLREEVASVDAALAFGIETGRERVARISSRDSSRHDETAVRETAIETLAENLNDSVVAPLFWFAVAGLPGAALYRYANTADAMWGYRGRWEWAGKWAARADDILSWLPARLTAVALLPWPGRWRQLAAQARATPSPNGGWPMGAMALALQRSLAKPGVYVLHPEGSAVGPDDVGAAIRRAGVALVGATSLLAALAFVWRV